MVKNFFNLFHKSKDSFEGQEEQENVEIVLRRHWFTILTPLFFALLLALIPIPIWSAFGRVLEGRNLGELFFFASTLWLLLIWILSFYMLTMYSLNTVVITNKRIIENEQQGFFRRKVSELPVYRIQDIAVRIHGFFETLLSFGEVSVQTAAENREFVFSQIPNPEEVKDAVMRLVSPRRSDLNLN